MVKHDLRRQASLRVTDHWPTLAGAETLYDLRSSATNCVNKLDQLVVELDELRAKGRQGHPTPLAEIFGSCFPDCCNRIQATTLSQLSSGVGG